MRQIITRPEPIALVLFSFVLVLSPLTYAADGAKDSKTEPLAVSSDFPGGSAEVLDLDPKNQRVRIQPKEYPKRGWVCWWYFKVDHVRKGEPITIEVDGRNFAIPKQAVYSRDGKTWQRTPDGVSKGKITRYTIKADSSTLWFAWGPPFTLANAQQLTQSVGKKYDFAQDFELCKTREGKSVPALFIAEPNNDLKADERKGVWIQARQHAWEAGSSWVARGFTEWLVSDHPEAKRLRQTCDIYIVPIMDIDNVERGAGGKRQEPQDHNRDWSDNPHWASVREAQKKILALDKKGQLDVFIDLHNPGPDARDSFLMVPPPDYAGPVRQRNLEKFSAILKDRVTGPIPYKGRNLISGKSYDKSWRNISKNWICENTKSWVLSVTYEVGWNTPGSTADGYQQTGRLMGEALSRYLDKHHTRDTK